MEQAVTLLVEDEGLVRADLVDVLEQAGFGVVECGTSAEALAALKSDKRFQGLVTDIRLGPPPDGWELARHSRDSSRTFQSST